MKWSNWLLALVLLLCLPGTGFAETLFTPPPTDKSVEYLGTLFGQVGDLPVSGGNQTLSVLMRLINQIVMSLGFIIIGWTIFVSSLSSAQEGEVMGKKWSSIWVPTRAVAGMYLLLPTTSGYSYIQVAVMWLILQSVGAADALWNQVLTSWEKGGSINQPAPTANLTGGSASVFSMFKSKLCETILNQDSTAYELKEPISFFQKDNKAIWGYPTYGTNVCGEIDLSGILSSIQGQSSTPLTPAQSAQAMQSYFYALNMVQMNLETPATEAIQLPAASWANYLSLVQGALELKRSISSTLNTAISNNLPEVESTIDTTIAREAGWIHAGGFYFQIVQGDSGVNLSNIEFTAPTASMSNLCTELSDFCPDLQSRITNVYSQYITFIGANVTQDEQDSFLTSGFTNNLSALPAEGQSSMAAISDSLKGTINDFITGLSGSGTTDPLLALTTVGQQIMYGSEIAIWLCISVLVVLALVSSIMRSLQPGGYIVDAILVTVISIILFLVFLLWGAGMTLGLYLPLIPYLLFLFGGLAWVILVVEAMVSSPLIALSLIVPSEDEIGKATQALLIIVGLFFRPILMIVGFVFASKLLMVSVGMLNYGFKTVLATTILGLGLFGAIAVIIMYAGILIAFVHESFSLIYVLPDKALRWMGVSGEGVDIAGNLKKVEGSVDTAAKVSGGMAKGATSAAMKFAK
jgi:conjugal transfer/type IV secretion protein DotA/TraY